MKYYLIAALTIMMMTGSASAQHVNVGIKGGLNLYNVHHDNNARYYFKPGFHAGLIGHIHITKHFAIQPEVFFSRQGAQYKHTNRNTNFNLDYINVPVLFQYMFDNGFRLQAGPQIGFLLNARSVNDDFTINHKNDIEPLDIGVAVGMSYVFDSGFGFDARYIHGLTTIYRENPSHSTNRGFQVGVFYLFKHKS